MADEFGNTILIAPKGYGHGAYNVEIINIGRNVIEVVDRKGKSGKLIYDCDNEKWYLDEISPDYEIVFIEFPSGPQKITYDDFRKRIIEDLDPIETSDQPTRKFILANNFASIFNGHSSNITVIFEAKSKLGAIVAWLNWETIKYSDDDSNSLKGWNRVDLYVIDGEDPNNYCTNLEYIHGEDLREISDDFIIHPALGPIEEAQIGDVVTLESFHNVKFSNKK